MNFFGIQIFSSRSSSWPKVRKQHLLRFPNCAACGRSKNLDVHHIIPVSVDPTKELDPDNLITLCSDPCHFVFGHLMDYKSWNINVINDCKNYLNKKNNRPYKN
jgi:5-methylcytosine-specific restriction enzyme A